MGNRRFLSLLSSPTSLVVHAPPLFLLCPAARPGTPPTLFPPGSPPRRGLVGEDQRRCSIPAELRLGRGASPGGGGRIYGRQHLQQRPRRCPLSPLHGAAPPPPPLPPSPPGSWQVEQGRGVEARPADREGGAPAGGAGARCRGIAGRRSRGAADLDGVRGEGGGRGAAGQWHFHPSSPR